MIAEDDIPTTSHQYRGVVWWRPVSSAQMNCTSHHQAKHEYGQVGSAAFADVVNKFGQRQGGFNIQVSLQKDMSQNECPDKLRIKRRL